MKYDILKVLTPERLQIRHNHVLMEEWVCNFVPGVKPHADVLHIYFAVEDKTELPLFRDSLWRCCRARVLDLIEEIHMMSEKQRWTCSSILHKTDISFWVKNCRCRQHTNPLREANRSFSGNWRLIRSAILSYQFKWPGIDNLNFRISSTNETTLHEMGENISCIEGLMSTKSKDGGCIGCTLRIVPKKTLSK